VKQELLGTRVRGWSLAILSNTAADLLEASSQEIGLGEASRGAR
jgi:hypothetical protein